MSSQDTEELGFVQDKLDRLDGVILRYPHITGPAFLACLALGVTWTVEYSSSRWPLVSWLPWLLTVLAAVVFLLGVESVGNLPGARERTWAGWLWVTCTAWVIAAGWWGPFTGPSFLGLGPLLWAWLLVLVVGWPPYWKHRRVRRGVEVSAEILAWDGDAVGLPRVDLVTQGSGADSHSWWARVKPRRKGEYTLAKLRQAIPRIAARYDVRVADVSVEPVREGVEGEYLLRIQTSPQEKPGASFTVPDRRPSAREPFAIAEQPGGKPILSELFRRGHGGVDGLAAGQKGYGKTTYAKRVALHAIACHDALNLVADMKPGSPDYAELGRHSYVYAKTPAQVDVLVRGLLILCRVRGETVRKDRKVLLAQLDESAMYFAPTIPEQPPADMTDPDARRRFSQQAKRTAEQQDADRQRNADLLLAVCRSAGISFRMQTQRGTVARIGGAAARSALLSGEVVGFFSPKASDAALLSDDGAFALEDLPRSRPGECLVSNGLHPDVVRGRMLHVTDEQEQELLGRFGADQGDLHPDELAALRKELGAAWDDLRAANRVRAVAPVTDEPEHPDGPDPEPKRHRALNAEQSRQLVHEALASFPKPVMAREVAEALGKSEQIVRVRLQELVDEGRAEKHGQRRWVKYSALGGSDE